jgi:hypothetical protein
MAQSDGLQPQNPDGDLIKITASVILTSGCQENQSLCNGKNNGLFADKLLKVWNGGKFKENYCTSSVAPGSDALISEP